MSTAYYIFPRTGKGTDAEPYGPNVPAGFTSWSVVEERKDDFLVAVEAEDAYHAARSGKVAEEVIEYETVQVPVARKLIDKRAGKRDAELSSVDDVRALVRAEGIHMSRPIIIHDAQRTSSGCVCLGSSWKSGSYMGDSSLKE